jgi:hypothetical protein
MVGLNKNAIAIFASGYFAAYGVDVTGDRRYTRWTLTKGTQS